MDPCVQAKFIPIYIQKVTYYFQDFINIRIGKFDMVTPVTVYLLENGYYGYINGFYVYKLKPVGGGKMKNCSIVISKNQ